MAKFKKKDVLALIEYMDKEFVINRWEYLDDERNATHTRKTWMDRGRAAAIMDIIKFFKGLGIDVTDIVKNEEDLTVNKILQKNKDDIDFYKIIRVNTNHKFTEDE
jgi:hypothetical protein